MAQCMAGVDVQSWQACTADMATAHLLISNGVLCSAYQVSMLFLSQLAKLLCTLLPVIRQQGRFGPPDNICCAILVDSSEFACGHRM